MTSRKAGGEVYLITRHTPNIEGLIPCRRRLKISRIMKPSWPMHPKPMSCEILIDGLPVTPFSLDDCYRVDPEHPLGADLPADSVLTTLLTVSATTGEIVRSACVMEPVGGVYVGNDRIALTYVRWDTDSEMTLVHLLDRETYEYLGSEQVAGALYSGGNNDFQLNLTVSCAWSPPSGAAIQRISSSTA